MLKLQPPHADPQELTHMYTDMHPTFEHAYTYKCTLYIQCTLYTHTQAEDSKRI